MPQNIKDLWLFPFPVPDVVHTQEPLLQAPELTTPGRCTCCRQTVKHRFRLDESWPLRQLSDNILDVTARLHKTTENLERLLKRGEPVTKDEKEKYLTAQIAAERSLEQAQLSARRLALRHVPKAEITRTDKLSEDELNLLHETSAPYELCAFCHAWHALNGYAAAQGVIVWLPDLHPSTVVVLNRRALQEIFSGDKTRVRQGREILTALMQNRLAVKDKFRSFRPADFADALRRYPPSRRSPLREKMNGIALILTPDSFPEKAFVD
ncbi:conjugal transfer protein TraT [Salmonella enterica subsp. enterica serovar Montevideo]|nr:conjugal transfer protein TraT [Salmonella enterica subsp. enterica serovar Montevideo]